MFWNKTIRETDKRIEAETAADRQENAGCIDVNITAKEQMFSTYGCASDRLNGECGAYIFDKAKSIPLQQPVTVRIHTTDDIDAAEAEQTLKSHYAAAYKETKKEIKRITAISLAMTLLGIIALTALFLIQHFAENPYVTSIAEIAAWVFIWEAVDYFFLQRPVVKAKCVFIQRLYTARVEICKEERA